MQTEQPNTADKKTTEKPGSKKPTATTGGVAAEHLRSYMERIERLEDEKAATAADIREVYAQAKADGFEPKIMRMVFRIRQMDSADREEQEHLLDTYKRALGLGVE